MAAGSNGRTRLAGRTYGSWRDRSHGQGGFMGVRRILQEGSSDNSAPTTAPIDSTTPVPSIGNSPASGATDSTLNDDVEAAPGTPTPIDVATLAPSAPRFTGTPTPIDFATLAPLPPGFTGTPTPIDFATLAPAFTLAPAIAASPTSTSSDSTPIIAGISAAIAVVVLSALGIFLRKRQKAKRKNDARRQGSLTDVVVGGGNDPPPVVPRPRPPPYTPAMAVVASAATSSVGGGGGGDNYPLVPRELARPTQRAGEPTTHDDKDGGGRVVVAEGDTERGGTHAAKEGGSGGASLAYGHFPQATHAGEDVGGGVRGGSGVVELAEGDIEAGTHTGTGNRGGGSLADGYTAPTMHAGKVGGGGGGSDGEDGGGSGGVALRGAHAVYGSVEPEPALADTSSTANISTGEREALAPAYGSRGGREAGAASSEADFEPSSSTGHRKSSSVGPGIGRVVAEAAQELARSSQIPGVSEAASVVSILVNLLEDNQDNKRSTEASLRRCRSIVRMLQRAAKVLGKGGDTTGMAERAMMEDVHDAVFDLVELVKTYQSKNKLSQVLLSTLFRRRQDEMGAVVDRAILGLQLGLNVQVGSDVSAVKEGMHIYQGSIDEARLKSLAEARRARRQRKLDQIEIPEDHVAITDELLGKGGFGEVYLADYNGRNAAAKVLHISHDLGRRGEYAILDGSMGDQLKRQREKTQRKAFLLELGTMIRLRSPYTVNVYGAVTSRQDRLVLVMELLAGGDLRTLLKNSEEESLPEERCRQIVGDICAGMAFLHSKNTVHGDLKSANVLLDGAGRAKIGDFGTSRWTQHTVSTGLATFTTKSSQNTQMSLAWSSPEVLDATGSTYASDVYSFGIVVWEVLSRELPWATVIHPKDIYIRVVLKNLRPVIPDEAPENIADVARACWVAEPGDRPTFRAVLEGMKSSGWNE